MTTDPAVTIVTAEPVPPPKPVKGAALARLAFGSVPSSVAAGQSLGPRHLAFLPPEALELDLGDPEQRQFGDYELVEKLGQGGMGVVYRARQRSLDREVAVKLLSAGPWASSDFIERFRREAQSAARMQHPNIVAIYEIGAHDELNFFSMRLVRGHSLAQELADGGPLQERRAAQLMRAIAEALDYAHRLGVLHLDLKPANVLIDERGEAQVADFGLARRLDETLTRDNDEVSGTPSYMAPEQAQIKSHKLSQATDIYGLGAILYELLTGRPPFLGASPQETLQRVITMEPARPRELVPTLSRDLEAVCLKCLSKEPGERYLSARALAEDLGRWLEQRPVSVRPLNAAQRGMRWVRREPLVAAFAASFLFALLAGLAATATQWARADANAKDARQNLWVMRSQTAQVALADGDGFRGLRSLIANLGEMEAAGKSADAEVERQRIGTVLANAPQLVDFFRLPKGVAVSSVAIAPDGKRFALATFGSNAKRQVHQYEVETGRELWSVSTDGLTHVIPMAHDVPHGEMRYTPDGSRIIVHLSQVGIIAAPTASDAIALDASDGRVLQPPDLPHADIVFSEDMRYALVRFRADDSRRFPDSGQLFATDGWRPLGPRHAHGAAIDADEWLFTPNGERLLGSSDFRRFTLFEPATLAPLWRTELPAGNLARAWRFNPDASLLALGTTTGAVFLVDTRDGHSTQLPSSPVATVRWLEFSADGATLVAQSENFSIAAWDVATRKTRAEPLPGRANSDHAPRVRVVGDMLYSPIGNQLRTWNLAPLAPFDNLAVPGAARLRSPRDFAVDAFDVYPENRLLIAAGTDGVVGFWRLPQPALLSARAAPLPPRNMNFDGERIVVVEGNVAQLRDAITQAPRSRPFLHPEPVRFAELSFDGRALVTIAGRTVRVLDLATSSLRGAPIVLPQSPMRADIARAAPVLAVTTAEYAGDLYQERVHVIDLATGTLRPAAPTLAGIPAEFNLDPLGRYVLAAFWRAPAYEGKTVVRVDLTGDAHGRGDVTLGNERDFGDFYDSEIAADGATAWTYSVLAERRIRLRRWALDDGRVLATIELPSPGGTIKLMPLGDGIVAHRLVTERLVVFDGAGRRREVPGVRREDSMLEFALSKDGRRAALATRNAVELVDLARGERLSAPLTVPIAGNDAITKLAFSPDATRLLVRTIKGRWLLWHLPMARQPTSDLSRLAALLDPDGADRGPDGDAAGDLRQSLRAADPGTPPELVATDVAPVELAAASGAEADPRFVPLDLRPALNVPLNGAWPLAPATGGDLPTLAPGMQRTNGIDWRIDGGVQLSRGGPANTIHPTEPVSPVVPVPMLRAGRVHVMTRMHMPMRGGAPPKVFARVVLIGEDGRETALEILTVRDVVSYSPEFAAPSARIGFLGMGTADVRDGAGTSSMTYAMAYSVGLDVPPDAGVIKGLRFEAGDGPMEAPLFYAATIEVADPSGAHPAPAAEGASR